MIHPLVFSYHFDKYKLKVLLLMKDGGKTGIETISFMGQIFFETYKCATQQKINRNAVSRAQNLLSFR